MTHGSIVFMSFMADCLPFLSVVSTTFVLGNTLGPKVIVAAVCMVIGSIVRRYSTSAKASEKQGPSLEATATTLRTDSTTISSANHHLVSMDPPFAEHVVEGGTYPDPKGASAVPLMSEPAGGHPNSEGVELFVALVGAEKPGGSGGDCGEVLRSGDGDILSSGSDKGDGEILI